MEVGVAYSIALYKMPQSLGDKFLTKLQQAFLESHRVSMDFSNVFREPRSQAPPEREYELQGEPSIFST